MANNILFASHIQVCLSLQRVRRFKLWLPVAKDLGLINSIVNKICALHVFELCILPCTILRYWACPYFLYPLELMSSLRSNYSLYRGTMPLRADLEKSTWRGQCDKEDNMGHYVNNTCMMLHRCTGACTFTNMNVQLTIIIHTSSIR